MKDMINTKQLADRWGMAIGSIYNLRNKGGGPKYLKLNGRNGTVLYKIKDVERYERRNMRG